MNQSCSNVRCQFVRIVFKLNTHRDEIACRWVCCRWGRRASAISLARRHQRHQPPLSPETRDPKPGTPGIRNPEPLEPETRNPEPLEPETWSPKPETQDLKPFGNSFGKAPPKAPPLEPETRNPEPLEPWNGLRMSVEGVPLIRRRRMVLSE